MRKLPLDINDSILGDTKYRNNVVTGEVATVNSNGTYDIYISGCDVAYPSIPTTLRNPDFSVGDAVEILIEYGNKELPIIIGLSKKIVQDITQIDMNVLVTTLDAYSITDATAYFKLRIDDIEGYENCTRYGFHYGTSTGYGSDVYEDGSFAVGYYNKQATGLTGETLYHFQAYVYDADGDEQTGGDKTFVTSTAEVSPLIVILIESYEDYYLKVYNLNGSLANTYDISSESVYMETDCLAVDSQNNIYYFRSGGVLVKRDIDGNEIKAEAIAGYPESIAIGADGYLYTREQDGKVHKRDTTTFASQGYITLTGGKGYYGLVLDSEGNIYTVNDTDDEIEKWSSAGIKTASRAISNCGSSSLGLVGNYIVRSASVGAGYSYKIHKDLGNDEIEFSLTNIDWQAGAGSLSNKYLFTGTSWGDGNCYLEKYSTGDSLDWSIIVDDNEYYGYDVQVKAYPF